MSGKTLSNTINQLDLINVYRIYHSTTAEYTFFSSLLGTFTKINQFSVSNTFSSKQNEGSLADSRTRAGSIENEHRTFYSSRKEVLRHTCAHTVVYQRDIGGNSELFY